jgi:hypothetical protein
LRLCRIWQFLDKNILNLQDQLRPVRVLDILRELVHHKVTSPAVLPHNRIDHIYTLILEHQLPPIPQTLPQEPKNFPSLSREIFRLPQAALNDLDLGPVGHFHKNLKSLILKTCNFVFFCTFYQNTNSQTPNFLIMMIYQ